MRGSTESTEQEVHHYCDKDFLAIHDDAVRKTRSALIEFEKIMGPVANFEKAMQPDLYRDTCEPEAVAQQVAFETSSVLIEYQKRFQAPAGRAY
jgi:hypothetical protein